MLKIETTRLGRTGRGRKMTCQHDHRTGGQGFAARIAVQRDPHPVRRARRRQIIKPHLIERQPHRIRA